MRIQELRIGNYVSNQDGTLNNVHTGNPHKFTIDDFKWVDLYIPIPLTEEWLLKFGFEKDDSGVEIDHPDYCEWYQKNFPIIGELCQSSDKTYLFDIETDTLRIKYVHSLQNLYFALCEKELIIK
jgi:hypothetical protein